MDGMQGVAIKWEIIGMGEQAQKGVLQKVELSTVQNVAYRPPPGVSGGAGG